MSPRMTCKPGKIKVVTDVALRMREEEFAEFQRRQKQRVAPKLDELDAWNYAAPGERNAKRQKYGNRRAEIDGIKFDSQHEANVYQELMLRVRAGELKTVCRQVKFDLPGGIVYIADFVAIRPDMRIEGVYDAKSEITRKNRVYINKKKQMKACWGIEIQEV